MKHDNEVVKYVFCTINCFKKDYENDRPSVKGLIYKNTCYPLKIRKRLSYKAAILKLLPTSTATQ